MASRRMQCAYLVHNLDISTEMPHEELSSLATHTRCVMPWEKHYNLCDATSVRDGRLPLALSRELDVRNTIIHLRVSLTYIADGLSCVVRIVPSYGAGNVDNGYFVIGSCADRIDFGPEKSFQLPLGPAALCAPLFGLGHGRRTRGGCWI